MNQEMKLAVLIDAENISSKYIDVILSEANNLGDVIYKRIYGNWTTPQMASWRNTILDNAIQPVQQYSNTIRKNSSDSALIIDTMDLLYQSNLDGFCIVSSDSDFTRLASRLRESQKYVLGMGESNVKNNIVYILCKDILYTLCKHIVYKFLLIEALIFLLNEDRCESDKPVSSGILAYLRQSSR